MALLATYSHRHRCSALPFILLILFHLHTAPPVLSQPFTAASDARNASNDESDRIPRLSESGCVVRVAVLDTGFHPDRASLNEEQQARVTCISVVSNVECTDPGHAHGTQTVRLLFGSDDNSGGGEESVDSEAASTQGNRVLRQQRHRLQSAEVVMLRVTGRGKRRADPHHIQRALRLLVNRQVNVQTRVTLLCFPLGLSWITDSHRSGEVPSPSPSSRPSWITSIVHDLHSLAEMGVVIVAAAGNDGPWFGSLSDIPAALPFVLTVGTAEVSNRPHDGIDDRLNALWLSARGRAHVPLLPPPSQQQPHSQSLGVSVGLGYPPHADILIATGDLSAIEEEGPDESTRMGGSSRSVSAPGNRFTRVQGTSIAVALATRQLLNVFEGADAALAADGIGISAIAPRIPTTALLRLALRRHKWRRSEMSEHWFASAREEQQWQRWQRRSIPPLLDAVSRAGEQLKQQQNRELSGVPLVRAYAQLASAAMSDDRGSYSDKSTTKAMERIIVERAQAVTKGVKFFTDAWSIPPHIDVRRPRQQHRSRPHPSVSASSLRETQCRWWWPLCTRTLSYNAAPQLFSLSVHTTSCPTAILVHDQEPQAVQQQSQGVWGAIPAAITVESAQGFTSRDATGASEVLSNHAALASLLDVHLLRRRNTTTSDVDLYTGGITIAAGLHVGADDDVPHPLVTELASRFASVDIAGNFTIRFRCTGEHSDRSFSVSVPFAFTVDTLRMGRGRKRPTILLDTSFSSAAPPPLASLTKAHNRLLLLIAFLGDVLGMTVEAFPLRETAHDGLTPGMSARVRRALQSADLYFVMAPATTSESNSEVVLARSVAATVHALMSKSSSARSSTSVSLPAILLLSMMPDTLHGAGNHFPWEPLLVPDGVNGHWRSLGHVRHHSALHHSQTTGLTTSVNAGEALREFTDATHTMMCYRRRPAWQSSQASHALAIASFAHISGYSVGMLSPAVADCLFLSPSVGIGESTSPVASAASAQKSFFDTLVQLARVERAKGARTIEVSTRLRHLMADETSHASVCLELVKEAIVSLLPLPPQMSSPARWQWWRHRFNCSTSNAERKESEDARGETGGSGFHFLHSDPLQVRYIGHAEARALPRAGTRAHSQEIHRCLYVVLFFTAVALILSTLWWR